MDVERIDGLDRFLGHWCFLQTRQGQCLELRVSGLTPDWLEYDEILIGYPEIPRVQPGESLIAPMAGVVALAETVILRLADREHTEKMLAKMNGAAIIAAPPAGQRMPRLN